ncbi:EcsC family protein [Nocardioides lentus]|uniref:EcsC family protein n=1 Tax=Nocardioides lentus TaxID=338077 RepID=A0ABN2NZN8_9ACTN
MGIRQNVGRRLAPKVTNLSPKLTASLVREAMTRAIDGVGPLPGAAAAADKQLASADGDQAKAVKEIIESHVRLAGAQGFATNIGGLAAMAVGAPANIIGLALLQCRMIAAIAHLRGYDLADTRTRNAILVTLLGEEDVKRMVQRGQIPAPPMALATAPADDPELGVSLSNSVAQEMIGRVIGKRLASTVSRRVPVVGGVVGASADGYGTWRLGRYADRELLSRHQR